MTEQENEITTSGASDTATSEGATTLQPPNTATEYPSGSAEAVQGQQASGFQKPADPNALRQWQRRAMQSPHFATLAGVAGRPVSEWGLFGKGATVRGLMLGINVDTLEKGIFHDGHVIERDGVWANARNFPEDAIAGDNL